MPDKPQAPLATLREEICELIYNYEIPHVLNPDGKPLEDLLLALVERARKEAVEEAFKRLGPLPVLLHGDGSGENLNDRVAAVLADLFPPAASSSDL